MAGASPVHGRGVVQHVQRDVLIACIEFDTNSTSAPDGIDDWDSGVVESIERLSAGRFAIRLRGYLAGQGYQQVSAIANVLTGSLYTAQVSQTPSGSTIWVSVFDNLAAPVDTNNIRVVVHAQIRR